jgi:hypothetical protein
MADDKLCRKSRLGVMSSLNGWPSFRRVEVNASAPVSEQLSILHFCARGFVLKFGGCMGNNWSI